jgi:hypothetical protein
MEVSQGKVFYKPAGGMYLGTLIDIVEKPNFMTTWGPKNKALFVWVLSQANGQPYLDPEGKPFQATAWVTSTMNDKSTQPLFRNMYKIVASILNATPPLVNSTEQLEQLLLGKSNGLMITSEPNPQKPTEPFVNIVGIMPLAAGQTGPAIPQGFIRHKNRPQTVTGPQGQPVQVYNSPAAAQAAVSFAAPAAAPAPTPEQIQAFLAAQAANNKSQF